MWRSSRRFMPKDAQDAWQAELRAAFPRVRQICVQNSAERIYKEMNNPSQLLL